MKKLSFLVAAVFVAFALATGNAQADVVRPAPNFVTTNGQTLANWKGQPVVVLIAPSPRSSAFQKQARRIEAVYQEFAARNTLFVAAFTDPEAAGQRIPSNLPFVIAKDGTKVAAEYGFDGKFSVNVIGKDGNLDLSTDKVVPASRIMDMIINNAAQQTAERRL